MCPGRDGVPLRQKLEVEAQFLGRPAHRVGGTRGVGEPDGLIAGILTVNDLHGVLAAEIRYGLWSDLSGAFGRRSSAA